MESADLQYVAISFS